MIWHTARRAFDLTHHALVMGILNVTPDSFSDGGQFFDADRAAARGLEMLAEGADILDIGGESTRPGAEPVPAAEEIRRTLPVIESLRRQAPECIISIDTSKAAVAQAALDAGAAIVNDVAALRGDPALAGVARDAGAGVVLMHMQGEPRTMQQQPSYIDVAAEVRAFLEERADFAAGAGIARACLALDPGIGFGKTVAHNLTLLRELPGLAAAGLPLALGVSRKSFLAKVAGTQDMAARLWPTLALTALLRARGARIFRVHDVAPNVAALRMAEALEADAPPVPA